MDETRRPTGNRHNHDRRSSLGATRRPGRASNWSGVLAEQGYVVGIDISGSGERAVLCDLTGNIVGRDAHLHSDGASHTPSQVVDRVVSMTRALLDAGGIKDREVLRVGIGFGGPVDAGKGVVRRSYRARDWDDYPLAAEVERAFDVPTLLDNDARLAALGEAWFGAGRDSLSCDLVYVHWSTGVGGGIVSENRLLRGTGSLAGEIGHMTVRTGPDALVCRCGGHGHLEAYVRSAALVERAAHLSGSHPGEDLSAESFFGKAEQDPGLREILNEAVEMLALTIGNLITAANPEMVVIGGRVARECESCIRRIGDLARTYAMPLSGASVKIVPAALGEDSGVLGAVALGLESLS